MKKLLVCLVLTLLSWGMYAQSPGDTIVVKAFKYGSGAKDSLIRFPSNSLSYEKIILKYNMRCKNALVSTQTAPDQGCGEWDYSCNTFIVDSSRNEKSLNTHPSHIITGFSGTSFGYVTQPVYDYYTYAQTNVSLGSVTSETQYTVGTGSTPVPVLLKTNEKSGRSQILYTAAELIAAGFSAGNLQGMLLDVSNAGGGANFLRVGMQHTTLTALNSGTVTTSGFTNVFNQNFTFTTGRNRLQFHTPFAWDGTSNLLIDLSFTNTVPSNPVVFNGTSSTGNMLLHTNNNYALDLSGSGHAILNTSQLASINNELTITFWAYGNAAQMPAPTVLLYGYATNPSQRNLSVHLPWTDNNIYFDCGYSNNNYDRISKTSTAAQQGGQWNHWAFTKNALTGNMNIYLNGVLWQSGTGKTKAISLLNLILGKEVGLVNNYKGRINELTIWDKALAAGDIQAWMNKPITASHPFFANLKAYYKLDEGAGQSISDSKNSLSSAGVNLNWTYERGQNLIRTFSEAAIRPNVILVRGTYAMTTSTLVAKDSVARNPNVVQAYSITPGSTVQPVSDDAVTPTTTMSVYQATPSNVYNGDTGVLTGTVAVTATGTITIGTLNYYKYYPYYNELLSFVTPYGKGLNLGAGGKTWYYDITDYTPLLKGPKRLMMTGGVNQEQLDIDFLFIVGTPPRNVLEFNQLWQGSARIGGPGITSILNDAYFPPVQVPVLSGGQKFKLRSTITGHGSEGEFEQNGGQVNHLINVNGGTPEHSWVISQDCSQNPVYPQGGTWLIDRQGWCPGETSLTKELDMTPYLTAGSTATVDYHCSAPQNPGGDYRYLVANQLITYGALNHTLDAAIVDVLAPSDKVLYSRTNPMCAKPRILVRNTGATALTKLEMDYWINTGSNKQTYTWNGNLASMDTISIALPIATLWQSDVKTSNNVFHAELKKANNAADNYAFNNVYHSPFAVPEWLPSKFSIEIKTNNTMENSYKLYDDNGTLVGSSNFTAVNTVYKTDYDLNGCYRLIIEDTGKDGLSWWANTAQGSGYARIKNSANAIIKNFQADFGSRLEYSFTTNKPLSVLKNDLDAFLNLYPNPAMDRFILQGSSLETAKVEITNVVGQAVSVPSTTTGDTMEFDSRSLTPGIYFVTVSKGRDSVTKKLVIH